MPKGIAVRVRSRASSESIPRPFTDAARSRGPGQPSPTSPPSTRGFVLRSAKRCPRCCPPDAALPIDRFGPNRARHDGVQPHCVACMADATRVSHRAAGDRRRTSVRARGRRVREENRQRLFGFLQGRRCTDCGEDDPVVMEFDHVDGSSKERAVADMLGGGYSWERIEAEIGKCEIVCANCHRRRTAGRARHYRVRLRQLTHTPA